MVNHKLLFLFLIISFISGALPNLKAQEIANERILNEVPLTKKERRRARPSYIDIGFGINASKFRDFATSPLFYSGSVNQLSLSKLKRDYFRESELGACYGFGTYIVNFNKNITLSNLKRIELYYSRLYQLKSLSTSSLNTKVGFQLNGTGNLRINGSLENDALGIEIFGNLLGSVKFTKDISRKEAKQKKIIFYKYTLKKVKRDLGFRINVGIMNSSFRNGFIYSGQSQVLNDAKNFDGYVYKVFSGFRMGSQLDYTRYLKNKNAFQISYLWDAYRTGGQLDKFEMAHHTLRFSLQFNTNNK